VAHRAQGVRFPYGLLKQSEKESESESWRFLSRSVFTLVPFSLDQGFIFAFYTYMKQFICCTFLFLFVMSCQAQTDLCYWIEPDDTYINAGFNGADNYSEPIPLPFNFNFFGEIFNEVILTSKGTIAMGNEGYVDFTPSAFPNPLADETSQQYDHICGFWSDFDFSGSGELYYKVTDEALYVNYINVGYWPHQSDLTNSFQMIICATGSDVIGNGKNVQFYYKDMQWANSALNGASDGFDAQASIAIIGADRESGTDHFAFGRFNLEAENYNGPYGNTPATQDGLYWLNKKVIAFNTATNGTNTPPGMVSNVCPDFKLCQDQYQFELVFTSSENQQSISADMIGFPDGMNYSVSNYPSAAVLTGSVNIEDAVPGDYNLEITATDAGTQPESITVDLSLNISPNTIALEISGETTFCAGTSVDLSATPGMDYYLWSNGEQDETASYNTGGPVLLIAMKDGCYLESTELLETTPYFIPQLIGGNNPIQVCPGQDTLVCVVGEYVSYSWQIYPDHEGEFVEGEPLNQACAHVAGTEGHYKVTVEDEDGCLGFNIKIVTSPAVEIPLTNPDPQCDLNMPVQMLGGVEIIEDNLIIYALSTNSNGWQGSYLNIYLVHADGTSDTSFFTSFNTFSIYDDLLIMSGDSIAIEYVANGNDLQGNSLWIFNCYETTPWIIAAPLTSEIVWTGMATCPGQPLPGQWTVEGPEGWTISDDEIFDMEFSAVILGDYEVCFDADACLIPYCYTISFPENIDVEIDQPDTISLCGDETLLITASTNPDYELTWTGDGLTVSEELVNAQVGPYSGSGSTLITVSQSNQCYSDRDSLMILYWEDVSAYTFDDVNLCGEPVIADPFPGTEDDEYIDCIWTNVLSGVSDVSPNFTFFEPGVYSVQFINDCSASEVISFDAVLDSIPQLLSTIYGGSVFCDNEGIEIFSTDQTNGTYSWSIEPPGAGTIVTLQEDSIYVDFMDGYAGDAIISVEATNECGSSGVVELVALIDNCSSVKEMMESAIQLYPNPANEFVMVVSPYPIESIELFNSIGQLFSKTNDQMIQLENLSAGMYFIRLKTSDGVFRKRLEIVR
jgi:hypothetical protein